MLDEANDADDVVVVLIVRITAVSVPTVAPIKKMTMMDKIIVGHSPMKPVVLLKKIEHLSNMLSKDLSLGS